MAVLLISLEGIDSLSRISLTASDTEPTKKKFLITDPLVFTYGYCLSNYLRQRSIRFMLISKYVIALYDLLYFSIFFIVKSIVFCLV